MKKILFFFFFFLSVFTSNATHIVGGEINYKWLGPNNYNITLKLYRDCYNGLAEYDDPAYLFVYDNNGNFIEKLEMIFPGKRQLPIVVNDPCLTPPTNVCVEEAIYSINKTLPAIQGGYHLVYQRCCRNNTILNIMDPGGTGASYIAFIPTSTSNNSFKNNNPYYKNFPPIFLCAFTPFSFDHVAVDTDGDSLVYDLCDPVIGADRDCPQPGVFSCPDAPSPPPYPFVNWVSGFSGSYPMPANPALSINRKTGLLTGTPTQIGQFVVGVCVKEYRNGVLMSTNKRDFQFNVTSCNKTIATIPQQQVFCDGTTVNFTNTSINATSFYWNFGDPNTTSDFSTTPNPTYTYSDTGTFKVMLIANSSTSSCTDTAYSTFVIKPKLKAGFTPPPSQCIKGNAFSFSAGGIFNPEAKFLWSFPGAFPAASTLKDVNPVVYNQPGNNTVKLLITQFGCRDSVEKTVRIVQQPDTMPVITTDPCNGPVISYSATSSAGQTYKWDFGDPTTATDVSSINQGTYIYPTSGTYTVMLISQREFCIDTVYRNITVYPYFVPTFEAPELQCLKGNSFNFSAGGLFSNDANFLWTFEESETPTSQTQNPTGIVFTSHGIHKVKLSVAQYGCVKSIEKQIEIIPNPQSNITFQKAFCEGLTYNFENTATNSTSYFWNFGDHLSVNDTSSVVFPSYTYSDTGVYVVKLITSNQGLCFDTSSAEFRIYPLLSPGIKPFDDQQCLHRNLFNFYAGGVYSPQTLFSWDFGSAASPLTSNDENPAGITYSDTGTFYVTITMSENGCDKEFSLPVRIFPKPEARFTTDTLVGCRPVYFNLLNESTAATDMLFLWDFGDGTFSNDFQPYHEYWVPGKYDISLTVITTSGCRDTSTFSFPELIYVKGYPTSKFKMDKKVINQFDEVKFTDLSEGALSTTIFYGDGFSSGLLNSIHTYADTGHFSIMQIAYNLDGCPDTSFSTLYVSPIFRFWIPNSFTPNGDGLNDYFFPKVIGAKTYEMMIFNRWGEKIFETNDLDNMWDGSVKGNPAKTETYVYKVEVVDVFKKRHPFVGTVTLIR